MLCYINISKGNNYLKKKFIKMKNKHYIMTLPQQFEKGNTQNIYIYHYVEELVTNFRKYMDENFNDEIITRAEFPALVRIRFSEKTTQKDIVNILDVSDGYTAKLLRKFEDNGFITREEDPTNRRRKIVRLTQKGIEKTDECIEMITNWETKISTKITEQELETLKEILFKLIS